MSEAQKNYVDNFKPTTYKHAQTKQMLTLYFGQIYANMAFLDLYISYFPATQETKFNYYSLASLRPRKNLVHALTHHQVSFHSRILNIAARFNFHLKIESILTGVTSLMVISVSCMLE